MRRRIRRPGRLVKGVLAVVVLALVATGGVEVWRHARPDRSCGTGVVRRGGECTGVTDGAKAYAPFLREVFDRIHAENERVADARHVTMALMTPMTSPNAYQRRLILHEVQGAYLAQYRANHLSNGKKPLVRLVLANPGQNSAHWRPVADQLVAMTHSARDNLRMVTGFDISDSPTKRTIKYLNDHGIPAVGGPLTGDDIGNTAAHPDEFKGFVRVAPDNGDQAAALAFFNKKHKVKPDQTLLVEDRRKHDDYIATLKRAFAAQTKGSPQEPEEYDSPKNINDEGTTPNAFQQMVTGICESPAKVIYFAGRPVQLRVFINELGDRSCTDKDYTVISGSDASSMATDPKLDRGALKRGVTVEYSADAHPEEWSASTTPTTGGKNGIYQTSRTAFQTLDDLMDRAQKKPVGPVGPTNLTDDRAILTYDAAWTGITAIRNATTPSHQMPSLGDITSSWLRLRGPLKVDGASGWICLDNYGNAYDKAVAVVRLTPEKEGARFVGLAWPTGSPPDQPCTPPAGG